MSDLGTPRHPALPPSRGAVWPADASTADVLARVSAEMRAQIDQPPRTLPGRLARLIAEGWAIILFGVVALAGLLGAPQALGSRAYPDAAVASAVALAFGLVARSGVRRIRARTGF